MSSRAVAAILALFAAPHVGAQGAGSAGSSAATTAASSLPATGGGRTLECLVEPSLVTNIGSSVDGVLDQVGVDRGDRVTKGQVVARLRSGVEAAAVKLSQAQVEFAQRRAERNEMLFQKQLISAQERDEMVTEVRLREEELNRNQETLSLRTILSPLDGVVVERKLSPGEFIRAEKSVVVKLAQVNPLNVEVIAPASMFGTLRVGMTGRVSLAPYYPGTFSAKIVVVDKVIDAASGTLGVRLQMPNPDNKIPAGLKCSVSFGR